MTCRFLAVFLLGWTSAWAQVVVNEPATHARLVDGQTHILLSLTSKSETPLEVKIELRWLGPSNKEHALATRTATLEKGASSVESPLPLGINDDDPLLERLRYDVRPSGKNLTAFQPIRGILNLVDIADYAFSAGIFLSGHPQPNRPYQVRVLTFHPVTRLPVAGVLVKSEHGEATSNQEGVATLEVEPDPDEDEVSVTILAKLGDFRQTESATSPPAEKPRVRIYSDKPLYQPSQTVHLRILSTGGNLKALADTSYSLRVVDEDRNIAHAAELKTSKYGIGWNDWDVPSNAKAGTYKVEIRNEDDEPIAESELTIRKYELPSFRVTVHPDRPYYLSGQKAKVTVHADYIFGKPVSSGSVRVTGGVSEKPILSGSLDASGGFEGTIDAQIDVGRNDRFLDLHFVAFVTDATTNRTEQRKFDLRVSRESLHLYGMVQPAVTGARVYVSAFTPDGLPAQTDVQLVRSTAVLAKQRTNGFGVAAFDLAGGDEKGLQLRAPGPDGRTIIEEISGWVETPEVRLGTDKSLYRAGESIDCRIVARGSGAALVWAWNERGKTLFSRTQRLVDGKTIVRIPYHAEFGRKVSIAVAQGASLASRSVLFPGPSELLLKVSAAKEAYRPGEIAKLQFQASAPAALGVAIVDESVAARAETDASFGRPRFFGERGINLPDVGGVTEFDLMNMDPSKIDSETQVLAAMLLEDPDVTARDDDASSLERAFQEACGKTLRPVLGSLERDYLSTLEYPRDAAELSLLPTARLWSTEDPWLQPFYPRFSRVGSFDVLELMSCGPDKKCETADDFPAAIIRRPWFGKWQALISEALGTSVDYPANPVEFLDITKLHGILFSELRDPWGHALRVAVNHYGPVRRIEVLSAGPNGEFGDGDDVTVALFAGTYFSATEARIQKALSVAVQAPRTDEEFRAVLKANGIDFDGLRDPWGHPYYLKFRQDATYQDDVQVYSYSEYKGASEQRQKVTPYKRTVLITEIRSTGEDGIKGSYDDFAVMTITSALPLNSPPQEIAGDDIPPNFAVPGRGTIEGVIYDPSGAVIPDADVTLNEVYRTRADESGHYRFAGVPLGVYTVRFNSPGFQVRVVGHVPVAADRVTRVDATLMLGTTSETVDVSAESMTAETVSAALIGPARAAAISTPQVREYFPETLYWRPELITDRQGHAAVDVKLADSITTWRVAVMGSTEDGRIAESGAEIKAFQPFLVDLDVPAVLTRGDEIDLPAPIRNYLDRVEQVKVAVTTPAALTLRQAVRPVETVAASSSGNMILSLRADAATAAARIRVTAVAKDGSDAIEKPVMVHPDGERREITVNGVAGEGTVLRATLPQNAIPGSLHAEVRIYPSLLARMVEAMQSLLQRPNGCAEQTISTAYANVMFLRALKQSGLKQEKLEAKARKNLLEGYQRLLGYQSDEGGFTYWGRGEPDVAVTAYALEFLRDSREFVDVDEQRMQSARLWLSKRKAEGSVLQTMRIRALAEAAGNDSREMEERLGELARNAALRDDPYAIAWFVLAAMDAGKPELARAAIVRLREMAQDEQGAAFWSLKSNTPFYGWGRAGQVETTGLAVSALAAWRVSQKAEELTPLLERGALFLLKNSDGGGGWYSSQATVRALAALLAVWKNTATAATTLDVLVNGVSAGKVTVPPSAEIRGPLYVDISKWMRAGSANEVTFVTAGGPGAEVKLNAVWYDPWGPERTSKEIGLKMSFDKTDVRINDAVKCDVEVSRPSFRGYGMLVAEIGLPPGAEVDRGSLESIVDDGHTGVDSYEVAPDHVTFYVWPRAADSHFGFLFRPRYGMHARAAQSELYDYYNPDEHVVLAPQKIAVTQ